MVAVSIIGLIRSFVPVRILSLILVTPSSFNELKRLISTSPLSTATPNSTMNPTPAEILNAIPRKYKAQIPPIADIGIAVKSIEKSNTLFASLFGEAHYKIEEVASEGVKTSFFQSGPNKIELVAPTNEDSPISKYLSKRGEGIHHIAFAVENIVEEMERLKKEGFIILNEKPKKGADNKLVAFVHPKTAGGVLIELCQEINN